MMFWCDGQSSNTIDVGDEEGKNYRQIDLERFKIERQTDREREREREREIERKDKKWRCHQHTINPQRAN